MLNKIILNGRLTKDVEIKSTQSGITVANFSVACARNYKDSSGDYPTDFIDCRAWRKTAEFIADNFRKGDLVILEGSVAVDTWEAQDGGKRKSVYIDVASAYFCGGKPDTQKNENRIPSEHKPDEPDFSEAFAGQDDDLPF